MTGSQKKFYGSLAAIAVAGAALIGYAVSQGESGAVESVEPAMSSLGDPGELVGREVGVARGPEDAPVVIEEYLDYQCPYCAMVARLTVPQVMERYVDAGKVRYIVFDFPVHPGDKSYLAAEAARCAGDQEAYWPMHDVLFARMGEWQKEGNPIRRFRDYAQQLGMDRSAFEACMQSRKYRELIQANRRRGEQMAVNSTPTFIINEDRRISGAIGFDRMAAMIEEELAEE